MFDDPPDVLDAPGLFISFADGDFDDDGFVDDVGVFIDTDGEGSFGGDPVVVLLNVDPGNLILDTNVLVTDV